MDHFGQLIGKDLLGAVELAALPVIHLVDLRKRQEGEHPDALEHVGVGHVAPILVEVKGAGLVGVKPHGVAGGLAHLVALRVGEQGDGHGVRILAELAADQLGAAQHIGPLVVAAELHVAAIVLEQVVEVIGLHDHVVEFQEGQALLHALLVALGAQHIVHREAGADLAQKLNIIESQKPVGIVQHLCLALAELDEFFHLLFKAGGVVVDVFLGEHLAHIGAAGRIADHSGAAADEGDGLVAGKLQTLHQRKRHKVAGGKAVCKLPDLRGEDYVPFPLCRVCLVYQRCGVIRLDLVFQVGKILVV